MDNVRQIQEYLQGKGIDAFVAYVPPETHGSTTQRFLGIPPEAATSREHFVVIYKDGRAPVFLASKIDDAHLASAKENFNITFYYSYRNKYELIEKSMQGLETIIIDHSFTCIPGHADHDDFVVQPYLERCAPTSADKLLQLKKEKDQSIVNKPLLPIAFISEPGMYSHLSASRLLTDIALTAFHEIKNRHGTIREGQVGQLILNQIHGADMTMQNQPYREGEQVPNYWPIVSVNGNASNVHYMAPLGGGEIIREGDVVLIDLWARMNHRDAIFSDITWMGFVETEVSEKVRTAFRQVVEARDAAANTLINEYRWRMIYQKPQLTGQDLNRRALDVLQGQYKHPDEVLLSRLGHAIDVQDHGKGINLDDFEIPDARPLRNGLLFSVEPGLYLPDMGLRSEINMIIHNDAPKITTTPYQTKVIPILADTWSDCWTD